MIVLVHDILKRNLSSLKVLNSSLTAIKRNTILVEYLVTFESLK